MTTDTFKTLSETDLELVCGGRTAPTVSCRGTCQNGDVELTEDSGESFSDPQAIFG